MTVPLKTSNSIWADILEAPNDTCKSVSRLFVLIDLAYTPENAREAAVL